MSRNTRAQAGAGLSRSLLAAASIFALQGVIAPALAQDARAVQSISLEGGSLSEAIVELSRESGVAIFASGDITSGITVGPLSGQMAPYDALERLIEGHGLEINASDRGALIVRKAEEEPAPAPSPVEKVGAGSAGSERSVARQTGWHRPHGSSCPPLD